MARSVVWPVLHCHCAQSCCPGAGGDQPPPWLCRLAGRGRTGQPSQRMETGRLGAAAGGLMNAM